jgi:methanogenic corrinoid protein MtbC1
MLETVLSAYNEAIFDADREQALQVVEDAIRAGARPEDIVFQVVIPAFGMMSKLVADDGEGSLAQQFLMARIGSAVTERMLQKFAAAPKCAGRVVLGTSVGDMHSLGKTIVRGCLTAMMFDVIDLGVSVSAERFVEEAVMANAQVIAVSSMMTHTAIGENGCLGIRRILKERRLENRIKIIVGGAPYRFDPLLYQTVQADGWAPDGVAAGEVIGEFIKGMSQ